MATVLVRLGLSLIILLTSIWLSDNTFYGYLFAAIGIMILFKVMDEVELNQGVKESLDKESKMSTSESLNDRLGVIHEEVICKECLKSGGVRIKAGEKQRRYCTNCKMWSD